MVDSNTQQFSPTYVGEAAGTPVGGKKKTEWNT
jgi:hypothetical protein